MISIVIISKDEASLDDTLTAVTAHAQALGESAEVVVVDASDGRLDHIRLRHQAAGKVGAIRSAAGNNHLHPAPA